MTDTENTGLKTQASAQASGACPYHGLDDSAFWSKAVAGPAAGDIDPVVSAPFRISRTDRIVTAGSCFAQHLARRLSDAGFASIQPLRIDGDIVNTYIIATKSIAL